MFGFLDFLNEKSAEGQWKRFNRWLIDEIQRGKLSNLLSFLFSDTEHIQNCYESSAFIRDEAFQNALMTCIVAVETNQLSRLKSIDPSLTEKSSCARRPGHRRSSSHPLMTFSPNQSSRKSILSGTKKISRTFDYTSEKVKVSPHRKWNSLPNLNHEAFSTRRPRSKTISISEQTAVGKLQKKVAFKRDEAEVEAATEAVLNEDVPYFEYRDSAAIQKAVPSSNSTVPVHVVKIDEIKIHTDYRYAPDYQKSPTSSRPKVSMKKLSVFSFLSQPTEASKVASKSSPNMSTSPSDIFFDVIAVSGDKIRQSSSPIVRSLEETSKRRKSSRQNLDYFLQTINSSSRTKVALDRENAHFHLSEAIIATSQQLKWNKILNSKYKIPKDVRIKDDLSSPRRQFHPPPPPPQLQPHSTKFVVGSVDEDSDSSSNDETSTDKRTTSTSSDDMNENFPQMEWNVPEDPHSAESIAMLLMSRFKNERLPNPRNLMWLVNESQAPQSLLPFPDNLSFPVNPDEPFHLNSFIRGSKDWAPPRQQIIFTVHPTPDRRRQCLNQQNRCAGCGMKVQPQYIHTFRYCDYLGKYFCSACHKNQISPIPARVLEKWDFSLYPVSNFSYKWLDEIWGLPLFHVGDLNCKLYEKAKPLKRARDSRLQLKYIQDFIEQCRFAEKEQGYCKEIPSHWTDDVDIWSMTDFVDVKNSVFSERTQELVMRLEEHIVKNNCELCMARGFICELCPKKRDVIFPWQDKIKRCRHCGSCYHDKCVTNEGCGKCERLKRRKRQLKTPTLATAS